MASAGAYFRDVLFMLRSVAKRWFSYRLIWVARLFGYARKERGFGLDDLDTRLYEAIDLSSQFYIELGANDGVAQSNSLGLEMFYGWRGLLIEPVSESFRELRKNRSKRRNGLIRAACVSFGFKGSEVEMVVSNLMSTTPVLESDIEDPIEHARMGRKFLSPSQSVYCETVPATTLTNCLVSVGAPRTIGLLILDVEGAELEVLKGIDMDLFWIRWILVESRDLERMANFLTQFGYRLQAQLSFHDYLFRRIDAQEVDVPIVLPASPVA